MGLAIAEYAGLLALLILSFYAFAKAMAGAQEQIDDWQLIKDWNPRIEEPQIARHGEKATESDLVIPSP